jgi:diguanylate cyclase (GGDEF)-like protein
MGHGFIRRAEAPLQAQASPAARVALVAIAALLTFLLATLRLSLDARLAVSLVLLLPTMLIAWYWTTAWALATVALVVLSQLAADLVAFEESVPLWVITINALVRAGVFGIVVLLTAALRAAYAYQHVLATRDGLTGLANRHRLLALAEAERRRARRYGHPITIGYLDLDDFKVVNDTYGHQAGDQLLRLVGVYLLRRLRSVDTAARLGGDEFVVLLPQTASQAGASTISELKIGIARELKEQGFDVGISAGVVTFRNAPDSVDEMLQAADRLMYEAKRAGKNALRQAVVPAANDGARAYVARIRAE